MPLIKISPLLFFGKPFKIGPDSPKCLTNNHMYEYLFQFNLTNSRFECLQHMSSGTETENYKNDMTIKTDTVYVFVEKFFKFSNEACANSRIFRTYFENVIDQTKNDLSCIREFLIGEKDAKPLTRKKRYEEKVFVRSLPKGLRRRRLRRVIKLV